jgi:hypothetical protein
MEIVMTKLRLAIGTVLILIVGLAQGQDTFLGRSTDEWAQSLTTSDRSKRVLAAWAIAQMAGRAAGGPNEQVHFAELVKLISDSDPAQRYWGVQGLSAFGQKLGEKGSARTAAINTLQPLLEDPSAAPRIDAAQALVTLGEPGKALPVIVAAMSDPQESVRIQAVAALESAGPAARPAEATLRVATNDSSEYVKRISERALSRLQSSPK